ncbi:MAG: pyruvoyl-dependent arginine decarboxylase [Halobaculum sp.]
MNISVAAGVGRGPTAMAAYDAALAGAGVHNYNLVTVSSVVPADATVEAVETAPNLGPAGGRLTVVQARASVEPTERVGSDVTAEPITDGDPVDSASTADRVVAGLGWATGPGPGLFYEATGTDRATVRERIDRGLDAGSALRDWTLTDRELKLAVGTPEPDAHVAAVVVAAYGTAERIGDGVDPVDPTETTQL